VKVLLDCDVLIDVATGRMPFSTESQPVIDWCERHAGSGFIAWHTVANLYYLLRKSRNDTFARQFI
jgi:predicted nucleic acid-binding protein